jgi:hypothetical protein
MFKMKKLLVLLVVLGLVSVANAGVIDVSITSINGAAITPWVHEVTINPSDTIDFRIVFNAPNTEFLFGINSFFDITGPGTLDWSHFVLATFDPETEVWTNVDLKATYDRLLHVQGTEGGKQYILDGAADKGSAGTGTGTENWIVKNIYLHCDEIGTVTVKLSNRGNGSIVTDTNRTIVPWNYGPGIIIHQIPEPMTLMLLGLGSLFLIRRKK